ncbi:uncharacterized protein LOC129908300 [Episyrphus balteatus]|uniref:uncharacterized protein LOC129908300 n=1 Tax=Episyrphus balteatus TaxID=286459 RepID=UPI002485FBA7|nr:uncharacterized protein LOC129908300 [Episyrphus balteatus]
MDPCALGNLLLFENECELENEQTIHVEGSIILDASSLGMQNNASEQNELKELNCEKFGFDENVFKRVADNGFDLESLLVATESEINELFPAPLLGTRAKFMFHLNFWRKNPPKNISEACKNWIESNYLEPNSSSVHSNISSPSSSHRSFENDSIFFDNNTLKELLSQTERGQSILNSYDEEKHHSDIHLFKSTIIS